MCGIVGIIDRDGIDEPGLRTLARLNAAQIHRGPDGEGTLIEPTAGGRAPRAAFAMRRLSIIDLAGGQQPLWNEDHTVAVVCNGEVYNFVELRRMLVGRGHHFASGSDCETIVHLYEEFGDDCVHHLRGMYAFALLDTRRHRLLLVRDRIGEKPLYLAERDGRIVFASEAKALIAAGVVPFEPCPEAMFLYLHWEYVPEPRAAIRGVRKLPAGHLLSVELESFKVRQHCYWRIEDSPEIRGDPTTAIREQLEQVAELVIRSDVPVGVCLSSGIDSSAIAALAKSRYPGRIQAVSVGFPGRATQDERAMAAQFATHLGIPFHEVIVSPSDVAETLEEVCLARDEPLLDSAGTSLMLMMKRCRELGLLVMLNGLGGDELFWGYEWTRRALAKSVRKRDALAGVATLRDYLQIHRPPYSYTAGLRWLSDLGGLRTGLRRWREDHSGPAERLIFWDLVPGFRAGELAAGSIFTGDFLRQVDPELAYLPFHHSQPWPERLDLVFTRLMIDTYLRENGLAQSDRVSMRHSVELRSPLVDYRLVETVYALRRASPDHQRPRKARLVSAMADLVPQWVVQRRKRGFSSPWRAWGLAVANAHSEKLRDSVLVKRGVFSDHGAQHLADQVTPRAWRTNPLVAESALRLELWARGMDGLARSAT